MKLDKRKMALDELLITLGITAYREFIRTLVTIPEAGMCHAKYKTIKLSGVNLQL